MKLDQKASYIEVHADFFEHGKPGRTFYQKAMYDVKRGVAEIISPTAIKLLVQEKPLKQRILERDKNTCQYCGRYGDTIDHVIPQSKYKIHTTDEIVVCACKRCNSLKGDMPVHVFIRKLIKLQEEENKERKWSKYHS
jgi:hypothetical protein